MREFRAQFEEGTRGYEYLQMAEVFWGALESGPILAACEAVGRFVAARQVERGDGELPDYWANGHALFEYDRDNLYLPCPAIIMETWRHANPPATNGAR